MRVLIAAGGTGGHVMPALEVARELEKRGAELLFVGTSRGLESRLVPERGYPLATVEVGALKRVGVGQILATLVGLPAAFVRAKVLIEEFRPDVAYGMGGYASGPVLLMAALKNIPVVVHEPNAVPGFANRLLAPWVARALVAREEALRFFPAQRAERVGVPVRREFFAIPRKQHAPPFTVLVTGGSQGSARLNEAMKEALPLVAGRQDLFFIHQTGQREYDEVKRAYAEQGVRAEVVAFIEDMPAAMARADVVVCRSGAVTLGELAAAGRAAILVPFPYAADQHQLRNARAFERAGAARVVPDASLSGPRLLEEIGAMLPRLSEMEEAAGKLAEPGAAERVVEVLEEVGSPKSKVQSPK